MVTILLQTGHARQLNIAYSTQNELPQPGILLSGFCTYLQDQ